MEIYVANDGLEWSIPLIHRVGNALWSSSAKRSGDPMAQRTNTYLYYFTLMISETGYLGSARGDPRTTSQYRPGISVTTLVPSRLNEHGASYITAAVLRYVAVYIRNRYVHGSCGSQDWGLLSRSFFILRASDSWTGLAVCVNCGSNWGHVLRMGQRKAFVS